MNNKKFYEILEVSQDCTNEDISNAYRRLALKFHPKRNSTKDFAINNYQFHLIAEAFTVLNSSILRGVYDVYGKEGLKNGIKDEKGNLKGGFKYSGNAFELFERFFGTINPFALTKDGQIITDEHGSMFGSGFGGLYEPMEIPEPDLTISLLLELEEIYSGGIKAITYERKMLNEDMRSTCRKEFKLNIEITPGIAENAKLTYPAMGNESPGKKTSNLIVIVKSNPHRFKRSEYNLLYTYKLTLLEALNSVPLTIETLDNRKLYISMDEIISPQTVKKIENEGLPIIEESKGKLFNKAKDLSKKGDLYINFDIKFPQFLTQEIKEELANLLDEQN